MDHTLKDFIKNSYPFIVYDSGPSIDCDFSYNHKELIRDDLNIIKVDL